jgi:hypothetical protein
MVPSLDSALRLDITKMTSGIANRLSEINGAQFFVHVLYLGHIDEHRCISVPGGALSTVVIV